MLEINPRIIKKIANAPFDVKLTNGSYKVARLSAPHGKGGFAIEVEVSHPSLMWASGPKNALTIILYDTRGMNSGTVHKISHDEEKAFPSELADKIAQMRAAATIDAVTAKEMSARLMESALHTMRELGIDRYATS